MLIEVWKDGKHQKIDLNTLTHEERDDFALWTIFKRLTLNITQAMLSHLTNVPLHIIERIEYGDRKLSLDHHKRLYTSLQETDQYIEQV